jgi:hypothetical protein
MLLLSLCATVLVYGSTTELSRSISADNHTRAVLGQAREALIGRALADASRPGSLPCPDGNNDGSADLFVGSACPRYLGRLPWRTLGTGDLRDATGERLWYALSPNFRDHPLGPPLNSDSKGTLTVHHNGAALTFTAQAIAVVFAPGVALPGQNRSNAPATCNPTGSTLPRNRCATNYLDSAGAIDNASGSGPYVSATSGEVFNDKLAVIVAADIMPALERRVALELRNALLSYRATSACKCYPWPDTGNDGISDIGSNRGRVPLSTALPDSWGAGVLPPYFIANDWGRIIYYAVAKTALQGSGNSCATCVDPDLSVDGVPGFDIVLITPGYAGSMRPSANWINYVDDAANRDHDDRFVAPVSQAADRDHLFSVIGKGGGCAGNARVLADNVPCGLPGNVLRRTCQSAAAALATCTCAAAASVLVKPPCTNAPAHGPCQSALALVQACTL